MTATEQKAREDILKMTENDNAIFLVGCGDCATLCQTGGEHEIAEMKAFLEESGKAVTGSVIPDSSCQVLDLKRLIRQQKDELAAADAVLVLSCGAGVQAATENCPDKPVYPGLNSLFIANTTRLATCTSGAAPVASASLTSRAASARSRAAPRARSTAPAARRTAASAKWTVNRTACGR